MLEAKAPFTTNIYLDSSMMSMFQLARSNATTIIGISFSVISENVIVGHK